MNHESSALVLSTAVGLLLGWAVASGAQAMGPASTTNATVPKAAPVPGGNAPTPPASSQPSSTSHTQPEEDGNSLTPESGIVSKGESPDSGKAVAAEAASKSAETKVEIAEAKAEEHHANRALGRKVRSALARSKDVSVANITVRSRDGAVTLQGTVPEQSQLDKATQVAKSVEGVTSVKNALTIRPVGQ